MNTRKRRLLAVGCFSALRATYLPAPAIGMTLFPLLFILVPDWSAGWWLGRTLKRGLLLASHFDRSWVCRVHACVLMAALPCAPTPPQTCWDVGVSRRMMRDYHDIEAFRSTASCDLCHPYCRRGDFCCLWCLNFLKFFRYWQLGLLSSRTPT